MELPVSERRDAHHGAMGVVTDVKMRRVVIVEVHRDHDPEKND
jgi:hypothetical protein